MVDHELQDRLDKLIEAVEDVINWFEFDGGSNSGQIVIDKLADAAGEVKSVQK
jgi:hypothetical protein